MSLQKNISDKEIKNGLSTDLQYACQYWILHLKGSETQLEDNSKVYEFLRQNLLYWLEALNLLGSISEGVHAIILLESMVSYTLRELEDNG